MHRIRPLNEEFTMTDDSLTVAGQSHLTDAFLWLVGAPLCLLDALYLSHLAPPLSAERPETLILWVLGIAALALLAWSLLCSACAHLALLRVAPPAARAAARFFVSRCGTRLSRSLLARAGASALIGSALVTAAPAAASLAAPQEQTSPAVSLTWADTPGVPSPDQEATQPAPATLPVPVPAQDAPAPDTPAGPTTITVTPGDSLWSIAASLRPDADNARIDATWRAIHAANSESVHDPALIYPGQTLAIPQDLP